jgi:ABC-type multidrug transport system ATPase subunit
MSNTVLSVQGLTKNFGNITAVDNLSFDVQAGQIFGLVGPNGSGKTTAISMVLSLLQPTYGHISLFGSANLDAGRRRIGATLESAGFYPDFSAEKNLRIVSLIKNAPASQIDEVLTAVGLAERKKDKFKNYSMGMKQRLAIAGAMLGNPELIILDEPTNGLDPRGIIEVRELIRQLAAEGKTIVVASHLLDEMEKTCTHIAIMQKGRLVKYSSLQDIHNTYESLEKAFMHLTV